ncbi:glycosyltransferase involved in cell wall biosynthesis [Rhodoferax ferrireducens]|uniref:Glycosyltransferase involved in cell wall biosynthesis n=2 Tax=Rhodoferax ferrireducens TaxID=192843 RepID=A0ABU2C725_9BURK|nr:glycosyltransferase involved in cell wall biosynthesis [Rhodoferax ferrireducens]
MNVMTSSMSYQAPKILIDAVFFQYNRSGIARVWYSLLEEWARDGFAAQLLVLDRQNTAPRIPGIAYRQVPAHSYAAPDADRAMLQQVCDEEGASLFVSSYYTTPLGTPSVFMAYDMIPEVLNWDTSTMAIWVEKHAGIRHARAFIAISQNTANDLCRFFPAIRPEQVSIAHCGVDFKAPPAAQIDSFKAQHGIQKPYFLLVGSRGAYKNASLFFQAFAALGDQRGQYAVVCTGPWSALEPEFSAYVGEASVHMIEVDDQSLQCAYAGAIALVYPSLYEGFGMPITEAMACGCPVITCPTGSIPEVAEDGVLYVPPSDVGAMTRALYQVQGPVMRAVLVAKGLQRAAAFSWGRMASEVKAALLRVDVSLLERNASATAHHTIDTQTGANMLSEIIPAEIINDDFYKVLNALASREDLKNFLEIGSSSGAGSTHAFVSALRNRADADSTRLYCMELSTERFTALRNAYLDCQFVKVYNQSSAALDEFPSEQEVAFFYANTRTTLNTYPLEQVLSWLRQDIDYMRKAGLTQNGIELIKKENGILDFDMVLIDGSEFTGEAELYHCMGARVIALDDVNSHKCFNAYRMLTNHVSYALTHQNMELRNGFAVFERRF